MEDMLLTQLANAGYTIRDDMTTINSKTHSTHSTSSSSQSSSSSTNLMNVQPIVIQCFDDNSLRYLHKKTTIPLVQLLEHQSYLFWTEQGKAAVSSRRSRTSSTLQPSSSPSFSPPPYSLLQPTSSPSTLPPSYSSSSSSSLTLQQISTYAQAVGPAKEDFSSIPYHQAMIQIGHVKSYQLYIHPWTFRADREIGLKFHDDFEVEQMYFYCCLGE